MKIVLSTLAVAALGVLATTAHAAPYAPGLSGKWSGPAAGVVDVMHKPGHTGGRGKHKGWSKTNKGKHKGWRR